MGDIMTTTFIRKIMKGKKIMQRKKERFDRISEARKITNVKLLKQIFTE